MPLGAIKAEIDRIASRTARRQQHAGTRTTYGAEVVTGEWNRPYSRQEAAFNRQPWRNTQVLAIGGTFG